MMSFQKGCLKPRPLEQQMAPLPANRIDNPSCYRVIACDLFGPMTLKTHESSDKVQKKVWGCVFTCLYSRGVHLELLPSQSTEAFLDAFRKFSARRGVPSVVYSDNGTCFKAADKELRQLFKSIKWNNVAEFARTQGIEWIFSTPNAPWKMGVVERLVRTVKKPLKNIVNSNQLTFKQLEVILIEIKAIVNNRPLSEVSQTGFGVITPAELNIGRPLTILPNPKKSPNFHYNAQWKKRKLLFQKFWKIWSHSYLDSLKIRKKWAQPTELDLVNKMVILNDKAPFSQWKLARIIRVLPSADKVIRNVEILLPTGPLIRAIQNLSIIENFM